MINKMKNIFIALLAITIVSCGSEGKYGDKIAELSSAKDSLIVAYEKLEKDLLVLEDQLYDIRLKDFESRIDSIGTLLNEATDSVIQKSLSLKLKELKTKMNDSKQASISQLRVWLKARNDAFNERISAIDKQLADLEGKVTRVAFVSSLQLSPQKFEHYFETYGSIESGQNVTINLEAPGTINSINVEVGQRVVKGQTLASIDSEVLRQSINEVQTSLDLALTVFEKQEKLWKQDIGSELQYLETKNRKESIEQKLKTLNSQLAMYTVRAPFEGIVDEVFYKVGGMGNMMTPLLRLINLGDMYLVADVSEDYLGTVVPGVSVIATFSGSKDEYLATVSRTGSFIKANNRTFKIYVDLDNTKGILKPNLLGILNIKDFEQDSATVVPTSTIQQDAKGQEYVYVLEQEGEKLIAIKTPVTTGMSYGTETLIVEGLAGDEEIVLKGGRTIKHGQEVKI